MNIVDNELCKIVLEDIHDMTLEWNTEDISDAKLRRSSSILFRFLIEGDLYKVARAMNMKKIRVLSSDHINDDYSKGAKRFQAGGGKFMGVQVSKLAFFDRVLSEKELKELSRKELAPKNRPVELSSFMSQTCIVINETHINREDVIKYVRHKRGGSHYDSKREDKKELDRKYKMLDSYNMSLAGKDAVFFELLSIGQKLVNNRDIQKLRKKIKNHLAKTGK